jgi:hypothetical protein
MFVIVDLQTVFNTYFVDMFMIYSHTEFHTPGCSDSLIISLELKDKDSSYSIKRFIAKAVCFLKTYCYTLFEGPRLNVATILKVCVSAVLLLLIIGN